MYIVDCRPQQEELDLASGYYFSYYLATPAGTQACTRPANERQSQLSQGKATILRISSLLQLAFSS